MYKISIRPLKNDSNINMDRRHNNIDESYSQEKKYRERISKSDGAHPFHIGSYYRFVVSISLDVYRFDKCGI